MHRPLEGIRILEVAQFTYVPAAGAVLTDWGADIVKVEHAETGDAQRGLVRVLGLDASKTGSSFAPIMEGPNRSKRSIGIDLANPAARPVLEELVRRSDVFLTNYLPSPRAKLGSRSRRSGRSTRTSSTSPAAGSAARALTRTRVHTTRPGSGRAAAAPTVSCPQTPTTWPSCRPERTATTSAA